LLLKAASKEDFSDRGSHFAHYLCFIDAAQLSMQLEILGTSFSESKTSQMKATIHDVLQFL